MLKLFAALVCAACIGCGAGLNEVERAEYDGLMVRADSLQEKIDQLRRSEATDFDSISQMERQTKYVTSGILSCRVKLNKQSIGPLPFRFKKGYRITFKQRSNKAAKGCQHWALRVAK